MYREMTRLLFPLMDRQIACEPRGIAPTPYRPARRAARPPAQKCRPRAGRAEMVGTSPDRKDGA